VLSSVDGVGEQHVDGGRVVIGVEVDQLAEPGLGQAEVQPEHVRSVEYGGGVVRVVRGDDRGPRVLSLRREVTRRVVQREHVAVRFDDAGTGMSGQGVSNEVNAHVRTTAQYLDRMSGSSDDHHRADLDLEGRYRAYLDALNERRLDDLVHYVHEELTYNGETMTRRQYQSLIAADIAAIPDLLYDARIVVAGGDQVACRIVFDCVPEREFLGFSPNGERIVFAEHVFYRFRDGRISAVSSLIDRAAIERQLRDWSRTPDTG
jgi:predicted ester cyclase